MTGKKKIVLLGATGSIGQSTLSVIRNARDDLELIGISGNSRFRELAEIAREFRVPHAALADENAYRDCREAGAFPGACRLRSGISGITELAVLPEADVVLVASSGTAALGPALAAIEAGKDIALANKEILVLAGKFVTAAARKHQVRLLPVDSEHSALFQCLEGRRTEDVSRLILTASGGAFIDREPDELARVIPADALRHPNWSMGPKVTIDSATMANKGLEMIEAHWLFSFDADRIDVVMHRQSIIHSMIELTDGSILAQLSPPCMTFAIHHALMYPRRVPGVAKGLDFSEVHRLDLAPLPPGRFPCLTLAREALHAGGVAPAVFNTANEVAVEAFLAHRFPFLDIPHVIDNTLEAFDNFEPRTVNDVLEVEKAARRTASELVQSQPWKKIS